jgi:hypothetical protein
VTRGHRFARLVFLLAGVYGLIVLTPQYFLEAQIGRDYPPAITHPEYFYGFIGLALAWQFAFLVVASDVRRYRPVMLLGVAEKLAFGVPAILLYAGGRAPGAVAGAGAADLVLGTLFVVAYAATRERDGARPAHDVATHALSDVRGGG